MKKFFSKATALLIVATLILCALPLSAFAADANCPIIFLPGVMGSRLYTSDKVFNDFTRVWDPSVFFITNFAEQLKTKTLYAAPPVNANDPDVKREYGVLDTYKNIIDALCEAFPEREVYFFSYDFRQSNKDSAEKLNAFITESGFDKVDLISHSMGGLVVANYVDMFGFDCVNKMVSCGTPYMGSAQMLNIAFGEDLLATKYSEGIEGILLQIADCIVSGPLGVDRELRTSLRACAELLPYQASVKQEPMMKYIGNQSSLIKPIFLYMPTSINTYKTLCNDLFGEEMYAEASAVQNNLYKNVYGDILAYEGAYFVVGAEQSTIKTIFYSGEGDKLNADRLNHTSGDDTVTFESATMLGAMLKIDSSRYCVQPTTHGGTAGSEKTEASALCIEYVIDVLADGVSDVSSAA